MWARKCRSGKVNAVSIIKRWAIRIVKLLAILVVVGFGIPFLIGGCLQLAGGF